MKLLAVLLSLAVYTQAQVVYPDDQRLDPMRSQDEKRRFQLPTFQPTLQSINDVESPPYGSSVGFTMIQNEPQPIPQWTQSRQPITYASRSPTNPTPYVVPSYKPSVTPFDNILPPKWRDHVIKIISKGITKFTLDMDRVIEMSNPSGRENLLFSPASLTVTLAMVLLASGGKTFDEVARILGLESGIDISHHSEIVHQIFGLMLQESDRYQLVDKTAPQCKFAFGIFVEDGYPVREQFRAVSEKIYKSEVISVDFSHHNREAQTTVNNWISNKTDGKIQNMLTEPPNPMTDVIITSALFFSGEWAQHFIEGGTKRKPFNIEPNETIYVDLMYSGGYFPFYEDRQLGLKILKLPYKGNQVSMYALMPTVNGGTAALREMKNKLSAEVIDNLIDNMQNITCIIGFPKMKLSSTLRLQSALEALGLKSLFDARTADLSVLSPGRTNPVASATQRAPSNTKSAFKGGFRQPIKNFADFSFPSRYGGDSPAARGGARSNFYRYEDTRRGYRVEQWNNGYNIDYISNNRRARRQSRPIDQEFVDFLNSQNLPTYGVDELRNTAGLNNPGLFADDVIHKVEMTINERGTEAAAATSVLLDRSGDFRRFVANKPFLFFIRDDAARAIWFWGTINKPNPSYASP